MFTKLKKRFNKVDPLLVLSFIGGLIPASFIIHIIAVDFSGFYFLSLSFLKYKSYAYQILSNYCNNPINTGVNARAPLVPFLLALTIGFFGRNLFAIYLPFFLARILIFPISYLIGKNFMSKKLAFLSTLFLLFIPKLQTYSFSSFEADVFIALFYSLSIYFYLKSKQLKNARFLILSSLCLGLGALTKSTGFAISIGFIIAILIENTDKLRNIYFIKRFAIFFLILLLMIGPYLLWTYFTQDQIYLATHKDKSILYIPNNLPALILTIPNYLGIIFAAGIKAKIISFILLISLLTGIVISIFKKYYILTLPIIITLILISTVSTCLIGGNITGSYEFITLLGFTMIPMSIILVIGTVDLIDLFWKLIIRNKAPKLLYYFLIILIILKFINNYFSSPYTLEFIQGEYYISLPTIIKNNQILPDVEFKIENSLRIFKGPAIHREIRNAFTNYRFEPFSPLYKIISLGYVSFSIILLLLVKDNKKNRLI